MNARAFQSTTGTERELDRPCYSGDFSCRNFMISYTNLQPKACAKDRKMLFSCRGFLLLAVVLFYVIQSQIVAASDGLVVEVTRVLQQHFSQQLALPEKDVVVEFSRFMTPDSTFPAWDEVRVLPNNRAARAGLQIVRCGLYVQGGMAKKIKAKVRVRTFQYVVVTVDRLTRHAVLFPEHLQLMRLETTRLKQKVFTSVGLLSGYRTSRILQPGEIVDSGNVEALPVITSGRHVDIRFQKGGIEIVIPGIARQDGYRGEKILVKSPENRKTYTARVIDARTVLVEF